MQQWKGGEDGKFPDPPPCSARKPEYAQESSGEDTEEKVVSKETSQECGQDDG